MAQNDYFVIVYKILEYLYSCMKEGKRPMYEDIAPQSQMFNLPAAYWGSIMEELIANGYVKGIVKVPGTADPGVKLNREAAITMRGVEFLQTNSKVQEAKAFAGETFRDMLKGIIERLPYFIAAGM